MLHVAEETVRIIFDKEFHPDWLKNIYLENGISRKYLTSFQRELLDKTRVGKGNFHYATFNRSKLLRIIFFRYMENIWL